MGMSACYMEAERNLIEKLMDKSNDDLFDEIEKLAEQNIKMYDMDKLWDGLHFILTGVSATTPIENNLLSEAIVGTAMFLDDEEADFIAYIYPTIWTEDAKEELKSELMEAFNGLKEFYHDMGNEQKGIIVSIY